MSIVDNKRNAGGGDDDPSRRERKLPKNGCDKVIFQVDSPEALALALLLGLGAGSLVKLKFNKAKCDEDEDEWGLPFGALLPASQDKLTRWVGGLLNPVVMKSSHTVALKNMLNGLLQQHGRRSLDRLVFAALQALAKKRWEEEEE